MPFNREKFKRLFHYVVWKAGHRDGFGATKLNKVLWYADARAFILTGKPITGTVYVREKFGPVPHHAMPIRAELEKEGLITVRTEPFHHRTLTRMMSDYKPDMSIFTEEEVRTVDYWIECIAGNYSASEISEETHDYAWEIADMGEELPLYAPLVSRIRDLTSAEKERATARARKLGLI